MLKSCILRQSAFGRDLFREEMDAVKLHRGSWITGLVIAGLIAYACFTLMQIRTKVTLASETEADLRDQVEDIQETNAELQYAIDNRYDPNTIEDIAREKLGLVMPEEKIFYDSGN